MTVSDARIARIPGAAARTLLAIAGAMAVGAVVLALAGLPLASTFVSIAEGAVGSSFAIREWLTEAAPITLTALGVAVAFRAGLFNLGGEGQIYIGALGGVMIALTLTSLPGAVLIIVASLAGMIAAGMWGGIAGVLRARLGLSEIITTIMLNFSAFWLVSYLVHGPIEDPHGTRYPWTEEIVARAQLGSVGGVLPIVAIVLAGVTVVVWAVLERTGVGLRIKHCGLSQTASRFAGVRVGGVVLLAMVLAGSLAGLGGVMSLLGDQHRLSDFFAPEWGFVAVAIALIGRGTALGTLAAGLFIAAVRSGVDQAQATAHVPSSVAEILLGAVVLFMIIANADVVMRYARRVSVSGLFTTRRHAGIP